MYQYISHITLISCLLLFISCDEEGSSESEAGPYAEGDIIKIEHQEMEFDFCYPSCPSDQNLCDDLTTDLADTTFSLSDHAGKIIMIEMSATW